MSKKSMGGGYDFDLNVLSNIVIPMDDSSKMAEMIAV